MQNQQFFIYARKSTDDTSRQARSIGDQIAELRELARKEGLEVVDVLVEKQSAKIPGRPIFNEMLDRIEKGEASGILAWHPDRLARNSLDGGRVVYLIDTGAIKRLRFSTFWFEPTPHGKLMLAFSPKARTERRNATSSKKPVRTLRWRTVISARRHAVRGNSL